jgi:hypothetical protein
VKNLIVVPFLISMLFMISCDSSVSPTEVNKSQLIKNSKSTPSKDGEIYLGPMDFRMHDPEFDWFPFDIVQSGYYQIKIVGYRDLVTGIGKKNNAARHMEEDTQGFFKVGKDGQNGDFDDITEPLECTIPGMDFDTWEIQFITVITQPFYAYPMNNSHLVDFSFTDQDAGVDDVFICEIYLVPFAHDSDTPPKPKSLSVLNNENNSPLLKWVKREADDIAEFEIWSKRVGGRKYSKLVAVGPFITEFNDTRVLIPGGDLGQLEYTYKIRAIDYSGNSSDFVLGMSPISVLP